MQKYTDFAALDEIEDEHLVKAKMALVLQEEHNIRQLNNDFEHLQNLAKILDNKSLNGISASICHLLFPSRFSEFSFFCY